MKTNFRLPELYFCVTLALLLCWGNALSFSCFGLTEVLALFCTFVFTTLLLCVLLWVATLITKRPIFGKHHIYYFPRGTMLIISAVGAALFGGIYRLSDHMPMTALHLRVYLIGYVLAVGVLMGYFFLISHKRD